MWAEVAGRTPKGLSSSGVTGSIGFKMTTGCVTFLRAGVGRGMRMVAWIGNRSGDKANRLRQSSQQDLGVVGHRGEGKR